MDLNSLLIWTVAASCGLSLLQLIRTRRRSWGRILMVLGLSAFLGICVFIDADRAGYYAGTLWFLLLVVPGLGMSLADILVSRHQYSAARALTQLISWIHPFEGMRAQPELIRALQLMQRGQVEQARQLLDQLRQTPTPLGRTVIVLQARYLGQWETFLQWLQAQPRREEWLNDPTVLDAYLQALGETQRQALLFSEFQRLLTDNHPHLPSRVLSLIRMKVAAFGGDAALVGQVFDASQARSGPEIKQFWEATALQVSGNESAAAETLEQLSARSDSIVARAAARRLLHPLSLQPEDPAPAEVRQHVLDHIRDIVHHERHFSVLEFSSRRFSWATWGIALVLLGVFLREVPGGSEDTFNLIELGALVIPMSLTPGEWWRIGTAAFLHFGPLHLLLNLAGLLYFGRRLERIWRGIPTLIFYLVAAIVSIGLTAMLSFDATESNPTILVGASGGVMGLIGALLSHAGIGVLRGRSAMVSREFNLLLLIVTLQIVFDVNHKNVSSLCHLLGLGIGLLSGVLANLIVRRR